MVYKNRKMIYNRSIEKNQAQEVVDMATAIVDTRKFLSETKFYEGYSRYIEEEGRYETWDEAVDRVIGMHEENYKQKNNELIPFLEEARQAYKEQRVLGAQRALQFGGEQL